MKPIEFSYNFNNQYIDDVKVTVTCGNSCGRMEEKNDKNPIEKTYSEKKELYATKVAWHAFCMGVWYG